MTDKEIIRGLECCTSKSISCQKCPLLSKSKCERELIRHSFDLINRQQAEIEMLKSENKILSKNADTAFQDGLNEAQDLYAEQVKNEVRAKAIKEFADRLKEKFLTAFDSYAYVTYGDIVMSIENIVKEMVGAEE